MTAARDSQAGSQPNKLWTNYRNLDDDPKGPYMLADLTAPSASSARAFEWHGRVPPQGRRWRYSAGRLAELEAQGYIVFPEHGLPRMKRYLSEVPGEVEATPESPTISPIAVIIRGAMRGIASQIAKNASYLAEVEWRDLERMLHEVFEGLGFTARLTRPGKDGGFDVELQCCDHGKTDHFLVEVKHWTTRSKKPGRKELNSFCEVVVSRAQATTGVLLSSSGFTQDLMCGRTEIERQVVRLGGAEKIVSLCQSYVRNAAGPWWPMTGLPEILLDGTL